MGRKKELNYMNAVACLCVILIHVLSIGIAQADRSSWQAAVIYFPWRLAAYVVPMFLYTGAVKMACQFQDKTVTAQSWIRYCLQRIRKIYLPYVLWVVIYYLVFMVINYVRGDWEEFFSYLWLGNLASPFYYIIIVMQFYLLMPIWVWMLRHIPAYLGITVSLLVTLCMQQFPNLLSLAGIEFAYTDRLFPTYLIFWVIGLYVGQHYDQVRKVLDRGEGRILSAAAILFCVLFGYLQYAKSFYLFNLNDLKLISDLLSIVLLHSICIRLTKTESKLGNALSWIYQSSFFVYLSHCLFMTVATAFLQGRGVVGLFPLILLRSLVCYTIPFLAYWLYAHSINHIKCGKGLLG